MAMKITTDIADKNNDNTEESFVFAGIFCIVCVLLRSLSKMAVIREIIMELILPQNVWLNLSKVLQ